MKIKMFSSDNYKEFEESVNAFIQAHKVLDIKYEAILLPIEYSHGVAIRNAVLDRVLIMYEDEAV